MINESLYHLYADLIEKFGREKQLIVAIEELAELQKELTKSLRGKGDIKNIAEEIADVQIMLEQLEIIYACSDFIFNTRNRKLARIEKLINEKGENYDYNITNITTSI